MVAVMVVVVVDIFCTKLPIIITLPGEEQISRQQVEGSVGELCMAAPGSLYEEDINRIEHCKNYEATRGECRCGRADQAAIIFLSKCNGPICKDASCNF